MIDVTAAVIRSGNRILICRRPEGDTFGGLWEFPGGKTEAGESPEEGLRREIREELEMDISVGERLGSFSYGPEPDGIALTAYHAVPRERSDFVLREHAEARWIAPEDLDRFAFAPADRPFVALLRSGENPR